MSPVEFNTQISGIVRARQGTSQARQAPSGQSFADTLGEKIREQSDVKLSAHAQKRLAERNVDFNGSAQDRLNTAVDRIAEKGADKSLVLMDDLALVVSARNRVVITAVDSTTAKDGVFTNIESAVIA